MEERIDVGTAVKADGDDPVTGARRAVPRRRGRVPGKRNGTARAAVLRLIKTEDPQAPLSDLAIAADLAVSEQAVSQARRAIGVQGSRIRATADWGIDCGLAQCQQCMRWYEVPAGEAGLVCKVAGHDDWLPVGSVRLFYKRGPS